LGDIDGKVATQGGAGLELHPGVFVSNVMTDEWRPDPEVGGEMHVLVEEETAYVGMSRFTKNADLPS